MSLLDSVLNAGGGAVVREMARNVGIGEDQAQSAIAELLPTLARGIQRNSARPGGLDSLLGALAAGGHDRYVDRPEELGRRESVADGNAILVLFLGSKEVSRNAAARAAQTMGLDAGILEKLLPMVAAATLGSLGKQRSTGGSLDTLRTGVGDGPGVAGVLESFLDADRDGAVLDDVLSLAKKFF